MEFKVHNGYWGSIPVNGRKQDYAEGEVEWLSYWKNLGHPARSSGTILSIRVSPLANMIHPLHTWLFQSPEECDDVALHSCGGPEGADSSRLPADHTPCGWTASPSLKESPRGASLYTNMNVNYWYLNGVLQCMAFSYLLVHLFLAVQIWSWCAIDFIVVQNMCCSSLWKNYLLPWQQGQSCGLHWPMSYEWKWYVPLLIRNLKNRYMCVIFSLFFFPLLRAQDVSHRGCSLRMGSWIKA